MLSVHPTKKKVCQVCGKEMSLYYHYPNTNFLKALNKHFKSNFGDCDHISDIWDSLVNNNKAKAYEIASFLIAKGELSLNPNTASKNDIIADLELACRKGSKKNAWNQERCPISLTDMMVFIHTIVVKNILMMCQQSTEML